MNELASPFELTLPAVSKHIKVLERAGLVVRGKRVQYRPCALDVAPLEAVSTWAEQYRPVWEARFDRMDDYLRQLDVRVGGPRRVCMEVPTPNGRVQMWFTGEYREVIEHRRLVYTESMSDDGSGVPAAGAGEHGATEVRVDFEDLGGRTRMVLVHAGIPQDSPGAAGWEMALDKLVTEVARTNQA